MSFYNNPYGGQQQGQQQQPQLPYPAQNPYPTPTPTQQQIYPMSSAPVNAFPTPTQHQQSQKTFQPQFQQTPQNQYQLQQQTGISSFPPNPNLHNSPSSLVEVKISAINLLDRDTFSKSDPVLVLYIKESRTNDYVEVGRTEQIKNNLNPSWDKKFQIEYRFEERQVLKFAIYDWDGATYSLSSHDFLGYLECSLGEIVAAPNKKFERNLILPQGFKTDEKSPSKLIVVAEELGTNKEVLHMKLSGKNLDKKDFFGKSDPFLVIERQLDDGTWANVHKSEVVKNTLNPDWKAMELRVGSLTCDNPERKLRFKVYDWNSNGTNEIIGEFITFYTEILDFFKNQKATFPLINATKKGKKKYTNSGLINIDWLRVEEQKSFLDYIQSGVQLHFTVAIDFTASNGDPNHPQSLHFRSPHVDNQYSLAIKAVGEIIQDYDADKLFPALGFGAKIPPQGFVSHEFFLNGDPSNPYCQGVSGILESYFKCINTVQLYGPTYFAPVINHVSRFAASHQDGKNYFVLLIITDGVICDLDATKEAIINASVLPLSLIIVGVGSEDFSAMEFLDSDGTLLKHNNKVAARDIVQFVELRKFSMSQQKSVELSREVLAEIPSQLLKWQSNFVGRN